MKLWLIRHGVTDLNIEKRCQGTTDCDLNATGLAQAAAVASALADKKIDAIYASPLKRAVSTAKALADKIGLDVRTDAGLMELNQGVFEGATMEEMAKSRPDILKEWIAHPADVVIPEGESMRQLSKRAWEAIQRIVAAHPNNARVAAVSHNLAISTVICSVIGMDVDYFRKFRLTPGGITIIEFSALGPAIAATNSTAHLDRL